MRILIDATSETIERRRPDTRPELLAEQLVWHPAEAIEPFVVDLEQFFAGIALPKDDARD